MKNRITLFIILFFAAFSGLQCQEPTIGLIFNDSLAYNGYTLFSPGNFEQTYLIDNCGYVVNEWDSDYVPGEMSYLLENGNIMRAGRINSPHFGGGGIGGIIQQMNWEGDIVWEYEYHAENYHQHHDFACLPNGNILLIAWDKYTAAEAIAVGRNPDFLDGEVWLEKIVEIEPTGLYGGEIVWEWKAWDHLIQEYDPEKLNFGSVIDHPEKIDFNYDDVESFAEDWLHANSIDYNAALDQIVISIREFSEIWVIDHSTTMEEASGSSGGIYGKGGDLLYRWGNPEAYKQGTEEDQKLTQQHDCHWIPEEYLDGGKFIVYNNFEDSNTSSVMVFDPPQDEPGFYTDPGDAAYGPLEEDWKYTDPGFYSNVMSGAQRLPNGNTLICEGNGGTFFEVTYDTQEIVWKYICPVNLFGIMEQGEEPELIQTFRIARYAPDYPGLFGLDLEPGNPIEINPIPYNCTIYDSLFTKQNEWISQKKPNIRNPIGNILQLEFNQPENVSVSVFSIQGIEMASKNGKQINQLEIESHTWPGGVYIIYIYYPESHHVEIFKAIK